MNPRGLSDTMTTDPSTLLAALTHRLAAIEARVQTIESKRTRTTSTEIRRKFVADLQAKLKHNSAVVRALRANGWTHQQIAQGLGCAERTVYRLERD